MYEELIKKIILKNFKTKTFDLKDLSKLGNSKVFLVKIKYKKYILRITKDIYSIKNNSYSLKLLAKLEITPKLISNGTMNEFQYSIETFLEGREIKEIGFKEIKSILNTIPKIQSHESIKCGYLNDLNSNWSDFISSKLIRPYIKEFNAKYESEKIIPYLLNNLPKNNTNYALLHGDLNKKNILMKRKDCLLFDFEEAFYGEKEYDLGYFLFKIGINKEYLDIIKEKYDIRKVLYYALCVGVRKIALSKDFELKNRIEKLNEIYKRLF